VLTALDVLGYERPVKLRGERARLVGLVLPELQNPIFPAFAEVVGGALAQYGFTPVLCTQTAGGVSEADYVDLLLQQQVSGVVFAGGNYALRAAPHEHYTRLNRLSLPTIVMNAAIEEMPFPCVACDDTAAVDQAMGHLVSLGHRKIGLLLGLANHVPSERKLAAARAFAGRAKIPLEPEQVEHGQFSLESGQAGARRLLAAGVTGIVCASDPLALGAIRAARRDGLSVPGDVSIIGYDDSALMSCTEPALTTVRQPIEAMGRAAIDLLVGLIDGKASAYDELLFEPELVVRASTGPVRASARA
jgi:DNA-binding LacI/PurR family transcriptional regulator